MVILAAVDRSERTATVVEEAERLAVAFEETVHVVHVVTSMEFTDLGMKSARANSPVSTDEIIEAASEVAAGAAADCAVPTVAVGLLGDPADQILKYASEHDTRYIVVAGRKRSPAGKALTGSVTQTVVLEAEDPVVFTTHHG